MLKKLYLEVFLDVPEDREKDIQQAFEIGNERSAPFWGNVIYRLGTQVKRARVTKPRN